MSLSFELKGTSRSWPVFLKTYAKDNLSRRDDNDDSNDDVTISECSVNQQQENKYDKLLEFFAPLSEANILYKLPPWHSQRRRSVDQTTSTGGSTAITMRIFSVSVLFFLLFVVLEVN